MAKTLKTDLRRGMRCDYLSICPQYAALFEARGEKALNSKNVLTRLFKVVVHYPGGFTVHPTQVRQLIA